MRLAHLTSTATVLTFALFALGSGPSEKSSSKTSTSTDDAAAPSAASAGAVAAAAPVGSGPDSRKPASMKEARLLAICQKKKEGRCDAFYNEVPTDTPKDCPKAGGEFSKGGTDCPSEALLGSCVYPPSARGAMAQLTSFYAGGATTLAAAKKDCLELPDEKHPNEWVDGPVHVKDVASAAPKPSAAAKKPKSK